MVYHGAMIDSCVPGIHHHPEQGKDGQSLRMVV